MIQTIDFNIFKEGFNRMNRQDQFSYNGLEALFNYLENLGLELDTKIEFDVIALCCEYTEYANIEEVQENYNDIESIDDLCDYTQVIEFKGGIIIQNF